MTNLIAGDRIYNHGDMANADHFGVVAEVREDKWGMHYLIKPEDREIEEYWIDHVILSPEYLGHGGTRIVTEAAHYKWLKARTGAVSLHCGNQYSDCPICSFTCKVVELERNHGWCDCCAERMAQEQDMRDEYADWDF